MSTAYLHPRPQGQVSAWPIMCILGWSAWLRVLSYSYCLTFIYSKNIFYFILTYKLDVRQYYNHHSPKKVMSCYYEFELGVSHYIHTYITYIRCITVYIKWLMINLRLYYAYTHNGLRNFLLPSQAGQPCCLSISSESFPSFNGWFNKLMETFVYSLLINVGLDWTGLETFYVWRNEPRRTIGHCIVLFDVILPFHSQTKNSFPSSIYRQNKKFIVYI